MQEGDSSVIHYSLSRAQVALMTHAKAMVR